MAKFSPLSHIKTSWLCLHASFSSRTDCQIVGSEIFNQLVICAGAVYACKFKKEAGVARIDLLVILTQKFHLNLARSGQLQLDKAIVIREVGFYGLSIVLLFIALRDRRPTDDDELGDDHLYISFFDACILFGGYIAYVAVCANMDFIVALFTRADDGGSVTQTTTLGGGDAKNYGAVQGRAEVSEDYQ
jgi:hypothetical protein